MKVDSPTVSKNQKKGRKSQSSVHSKNASPSKGGRSAFSTLFCCAVVPAVLFGLFAVLDQYKERGYIFDTETLHQAALKGIGPHGNRTMNEIIDIILDNLQDRYPGHINVKQEWLFNNAGGAMGSLFLIHASLTEYLIIFGTPIGTEGHTGRFFADDYFTILQGEQWAFAEGNFTKEIYQPGQMHHLPRGEAKAYRMPDNCWALEYARGFIPLMLPFGVADTLSSTLDVVTLGRTFVLYGKLVVNELLQGKF